MRKLLFPFVIIVAFMAGNAYAADNSVATDKASKTTEDYTYGGNIPISEPNALPQKTQHALDGVTVEYQYQTGWAIHMELYDGKLKYEWIAGPAKGEKNKDLPYRSMKIGPNTYMINWYEANKAHPDFITLIFNFDTRVMHGSGIVNFGGRTAPSDQQFGIFDGGIINNTTYKAK